MYISCFKVVLFSLPIPIIYYINFQNLLGIEFVDILLMVSISAGCVVVTIWHVGLDLSMKNRIIGIVKSRYKR